MGGILYLILYRSWPIDCVCFKYLGINIFNLISGISTYDVLCLQFLRKLINWHVSEYTQLKVEFSVLPDMTWWNQATVAIAAAAGLLLGVKLWPDKYESDIPVWITKAYHAICLAVKYSTTEGDHSCLYKTLLPQVLCTKVLKSIFVSSQNR